MNWIPTVPRNLLFGFTTMRCACFFVSVNYFSTRNVGPIIRTSGVVSGRILCWPIGALGWRGSFYNIPCSKTREKRQKTGEKRRKTGNIYAIVVSVIFDFFYRRNSVKNGRRNLKLYRILILSFSKCGEIFILFYSYLIYK